jgi:hypothetical protein
MHTSKGARNIAKVRAAASAILTRFRVLSTAFWAKHIFLVVSGRCNKVEEIN